MTYFINIKSKINIIILKLNFKKFEFFSFLKMAFLTKKAKGISSIISAIIMNIICGSLYSWAGINGYFISYLKYKGSPLIEIKDGYFFGPIITFSSMCFSPLMTLLDDKIGIKLMSLLSTIIVLITNILLYHSTNIFYVYGCMVMFGIINSINYMPLIKNCLLYFPDKKGLINGFILFGYGTSSLIYNSIADYLINPEYKKINPSTGFFDKDIALNVQNYLIFFNIFNGIMAVISFLLQFEYKKEKDKDKEYSGTKESKKEEDEELSITLKEAFIQATKGKQLYQLWTMSTILQVVSFTISNTYRSFAQQCFMEEYLLSNLTKVYSILNGLSRLIWGALFDKFSFKCLYGICIITQILVDSILFYSVHYPYLFFFLLCFQSIVISGKISLNVTMFIKVYGIKYFGFIYTVFTSIGGFTHLLGPFIIKIVIKSTNDYEKLYIGGAVFSCFALVVLFFFSEKKFVYKINKENDVNGKELEEKLN